MNADDFKALDEAFNRAIDLEGPKRAQFLEELKQQSPVWLDRLLAMLSAAEMPNDQLLDSVQRAADEYSSSIPDQIGPFRVIRELGVGGMGAVYLCERSDSDFVQQVVVKRPGYAGVDTRLVRERLALERRVLASLHHPNIAQFIDGGDEDGVPYVAMEYADGDDIVEFADANNLSHRQRIELFLLLCAAVQFAHRNSIIHRDIKPDNVLVDVHGQVKLLDFGIAKLLEDTGPNPEQDTQTVASSMTPSYASPEQVAGEMVSQSSDIYSLGMILYELLAGQPAYRIDSSRPSEIERIVCQLIPTAPSRINGMKGAKARDLDAIVLKALHKEPERRYASAAELAEDLKRWLDDRPVIARPDSTWYRLRTFARRHPFGVGTGVFSMLALVGFTSAMVWQAHRLSIERDRAAHEALVATESSDFIMQLFLDSNPLNQNPAELRALDLLDTAAEQLPDSLPNDPLVQARLMEQVGRAFGHLGDYDQSIQMLRGALQIAESEAGPDSFEATRARLYLGSALRQNSQLDEAEAHLHQSIDWLYRNDSEEFDLSRAYNHLGIVQRNLGRLDDAEASLRLSIQLYLDSLGDQAEGLAAPYHNLARALNSMDKLEEARVFAIKALEIQQLHDHPPARRGLTLGTLSVIERRLGMLDEAVTNARHSLALYRQVYGNDNHLITRRMGDLARVLFDLGKNDEVRELFEEALTIHRTIGTIDQIAGAQTKMSYGRFLIQINELEQARPLIEEAHAVALDFHQPDSIDMRTFNSGLQELQEALQVDQDLN